VEFTAENIPSLPAAVLPSLLTTIRTNNAFAKEKAALLKTFQTVYPVEAVGMDLIPQLYAERAETNRVNHVNATESWMKQDSLLTASPAQVKCPYPLYTRDIFSLHNQGILHYLVAGEMLQGNRKKS
jgi:hypothetical protein